ncbi:MAG: NAD(P)H-dependent oxidoreductase subunit E [bacterium]
MSESELPRSVIDYIEKTADREHPDSFLIPVLQKVQQEEGYLSEEMMDEVARQMEIPYAKVSGVASFYHYFNFQPSGEYEITICTGTACYVRGAGAVLNRFQEELGIDKNETTDNGKFSINDARCVGACGKAPVVIVNEKLFGQVTPDDVPDILAEYGYDPEE